MTEVSVDDLHCAVGRVVVIAAQLEQALSTLAYAALGADDAAFATTHARQPSQLRDLILPQAESRTGEWWSGRAISLVPEAMEVLEDRNMIVHGYWTDLQGIVDSRQFITFKPDRKSKTWNAKYFDLAGLGALADRIEAIHLELRELADSFVDALHRPSKP